MKRTPLKRSTKPMKRTPLNPVSKKRRSEKPRVDRWNQAVYDRDKQCKMCGAIDHLDAHHIWGKGAFPEWRYVLENGVTLCRQCHTYTHIQGLDLSTIGIDRDALRAEFMAGIGTIID